MQPWGSNMHQKVCARHPALIITHCHYLHLKMSQCVSPEAFWKQELVPAVAP